jgi:hypothetical protein
MRAHARPARPLPPLRRREGTGEYDEWLCFAAGGERGGVASVRVDAVRHCGSCTALIEPEDSDEGLLDDPEA